MHETVGDKRHAARAKKAFRDSSGDKRMDNRHSQALHHAAACGDQHIVELLVAAGADTQAMDADLRTAVDMAGSVAQSPSLMHEYDSGMLGIAGGCVRGPRCRCWGTQPK
mmetsp:Transcript_13538/g.41898  ORF Transcript_13538/g.41898 Transcript_13538/m.41898 type:complete len:110 (+) Transcript_13538:591-920(+)